MIRVRPEVVNTSGQEEAHKNNENEKVSDMYESITTLFKICGSYSAHSGKNSKAVCNGHFIYCIILQLIVLIISSRYFTVFRHGDQLYKTIGLVTFSYYYVIMVFLSFVCFYSNYKYLSLFYVTVDKYYNKYGLFLDISKTKTWLRRIVVATLIIVFLSTFTAIAVIYFHVERSLLIKSLYTPFDEVEGFAFLIVSVVMGIIGVFYHTIMYSNVMFLLTTLHLIKGEFQHVWRIIHDNINNKQLDNLEHLRLQHHKLTEIVEIGNLMFCHVAGTTYGYGIPIVCLMLYGVTTHRFDIADVFAMSSILATAVIEMFITTFMGADLNEKAHAPLQDLFKVEVSNESQQTVNQIQLFIAKLTGPPIGVSVYGLFVIDKSTILMVFGTIISYAVIVVQFTITQTCEIVPTNSTHL